MRVRRRKATYNRRMLRLLALLIVLLAAAAPADAPVRIVDSVASYRIEGATAQELWNQIHVLGPLEVDQKRYAADTRWSVTWHYEFSTEAGTCRVAQADVTFSDVMTLPEWVDQADGSRALQGAWASFVAQLKVHEAGHRRNGMQAALTIRHVIDGLGTERDCAVLGNAIETAAREAIVQAHSKDVDYDATTRHGETQGATLP